jgi:hypothetical protein
VVLGLVVVPQPPKELEFKAGCPALDVVALLVVLEPLASAPVIADHTSAQRPVMTEK